MKTLPLSSITVSEDRHRRTFPEAKLQELADSIQSEGLFHAIVLRPSGDDFILVAGERRLRACGDLHSLGLPFTYDGEQVPAGHIPYTLLGDLDPLARELAELNENIKRDDLTFQDRAAAVARIAELRKQAAEAVGDPAPSLSVIASEVAEPVREGFSGSAWQTEEVRQQLVVARNLDTPEVQNAKTLGEAFKALKRKDARVRAERMAQKVGETLSRASHQAFNADALTWLASAPADHFSVILTDPPYGMGADEFGDSGGATAGAHSYEDTSSLLLKILDTAPVDLWRCAAPQAHLYWFCDIEWFPTISTAFAAAGWRVHRTPLVWFKPAAFRAPWPEHGPQRKYELILYAVKGDRKTQKLAGDVLQFNPDSNLGHMAQKPVALYQELLSRSALPGEHVLDPFCGSGPIFPAAHELKLRATGIEIDPASYGLALQRLEALK